MLEARSVRNVVALVLCCCLAVLVAGCERAEEQPDAAAGDTLGADTAGAERQSLSVADVGFETPESALHDPAADVYLVSNINGDPLEKDGNGFISRITPAGQVQQLKWIDGESDGVVLNAPKGMAIRGDTLFVADIDSVRAFDRNSGQPLGARGVPGASFLNDLAMGDDGTLYVTDSGFGAGFQPSGTDAIYRFEGGRAVRIAQGEELQHPNGIVATDQGVTMVTFGGAALLRVTQGAAPSQLATLPAGQLDGLVRMPDGSHLVSSWEGEAVYRVREDGQAEPVVQNVTSPADIGYDEQRGRVLIPLFQENRLEIRGVR